MPEMTEEQRQELEEKIKKMSPEELREFQKQQCIFCQIISGKVPSKKIYSDEVCLAVLDINPAAKGHILILPKEHYAIMPQVPDKIQGQMFLVAKYLSQVLLRALKANGTTVFVANGLAAGQKAQHFMLHLIPGREGDKLLDGEEKLLNKELQEKVKFLIEKRLNELLGIKKEVVKVKAEEKKPLAVEEGKKVTPAKPELEEEKEEAEEGPEEKPPEKPKEKTLPSKKKATSKKFSQKGKSEEKEKTAEKGVSLDDIASLFK